MTRLFLSQWPSWLPAMVRECQALMEPTPDGPGRVQGKGIDYSSTLGLSTRDAGETTHIEKQDENANTAESRCIRPKCPVVESCRVHHLMATT